jgi:hypothetical protein
LVTPTQPISYFTISLYSPTSLPTAEKRNKRETNLKKTRGVFLAYMEIIPLSFSAMAELVWPVLETMQEHMQKSSKSKVYDSGGISYLSCSYGSGFPCPEGGICRGVLGIL